MYLLFLSKLRINASATQYRIAQVLKSSVVPPPRKKIEGVPLFLLPDQTRAAIMAKASDGV